LAIIKNLESREDKYNRRISKLEEHQERTRKSAQYSSDRFDILIISLSTFAIVLTASFLKTKDLNFSCLAKVVIKYSLAMFSTALISNLMSQVTGYFANKYEIEITTNLIRKLRGKLEKGNQKCKEKTATVLDTTTLLLNALSILSLIIGIILFIKLLYLTI
jgi:hypothetical protein